MLTCCRLSLHIYHGVTKPYWYCITTQKEKCQMIHRCVDNIKMVVKCLALQIFRKEKAPKKNMSHLWFSSFWLSEIEDCQEATCCLIWLETCIFFTGLSLCVRVCVCARLWRSSPAHWSLFRFLFICLHTAAAATLLFSFHSSALLRCRTRSFSFYSSFCLKKRENCCCGSRDRRP